MFLHLGSDTVVALDEVISINDYKTTRSSVNRDFIKNIRDINAVTDISSNTPKSFIVTKDRIYLSAISSVTLKKRAINIFFSED